MGTDLRVDVADGVALWTISRPEAGNAMGGTLLGDLLRAAAAAAADDAVRVVVTAAEGPNWCVGADLADLEQAWGTPLEDLLAGDSVGGEKGLPPLTGAARRLDRLGIGRWVQAFRALDKPLIAAVDGPVAGGGLALLALHDVRLASDRARFTAGFANVGVGPEMGLSWFLPRLVGPGRAADLLLSGRVMDSDEAERAGLVSRIVPSAALLDETLAYAARLARMPRLGVQATTAALRASFDHDLSTQLELEWHHQRDCFADPEGVGVVRALRARLAARAKGGS